MKTIRKFMLLPLAVMAVAACTKTGIPDIYDPDDPRARLRLSEIGTSDSYKFIEIYNPTSSAIALGGVSLWKNGDMFEMFTSSQSIPAGGYGVYRGRDSAASIIAPGGIDLGATQSGLSGSKSLSVELRFGKTIIDAFANTANPGVTQMAAGDWDGEPEIESSNFIRPKGIAYGWYAAPGTASATPGAANGISGTRLKHQRFAQDAVASAPYIASITINPHSPATGLTPGNNVIQFSVYYDVHSQAPVPSSSAGAVTSVKGIVWQITPSITGSAAGTEKEITLTAANAAGSVDKKITVLGFPDGTDFGTCGDIRLNEIRTSTRDGIELYNTSFKPVVIGGMRIRKNKDNMFTIPGHMVLKGGGFAVLGCNGKDYSTTAASYLNLGTVADGLSGTKSLLVELRKPWIAGDLTNSVNVDSFFNISTTVARPDKNSAWDIEGFVEYTITGAAGRKPDGTGPWYLFTDATPSMGASNTASTITGSAFTRTYHQDGN